MTQEQLKNRIEELKSKHDYSDCSTPLRCSMQKQIFRLEQLYDDLYGN